MALKYITAADAAVVLNYGETSQAVVAGLDTIGQPSLTREEITVNEFRTLLARKFAGGATVGNLTFSGTQVFGDTQGQDQLKAYWKANAKIVNARVYLDLEDFIAPDVASDATSSWQVMEVSPGEADKNGVFKFSGAFLLNGLPAYFTAHRAGGTTLAFVRGSSSADTITDSGSGFVTAGFQAGDTIIVEGSTGNNGQYKIKTVAAGVLTLDNSGGALTSASGTATTTIHGGRL